jgi:hypothetical protein
MLNFGVPVFTNNQDGLGDASMKKFFEEVNGLRVIAPPVRGIGPILFIIVLWIGRT